MICYGLWNASEYKATYSHLFVLVVILHKTMHEIFVLPSIPLSALYFTEERKADLSRETEVKGSSTRTGQLCAAVWVQPSLTRFFSKLSIILTRKGDQKHLPAACDPESSLSGSQSWHAFITRSRLWFLPSQAQALPQFGIYSLEVGGGLSRR